jgi:Calcineurin-like phosphoesterase
MIAQVLNQGFMESVREFVLEDLAEAASGEEERRDGEPHPADEVTAEEFEQARGALGKPRGDGAAERRGEETGEGDEGEDFVYMPRDAAMSLLQSTVERWFAEKAPQAVLREPADDERRGGGEVLLSEESLADLPAESDGERRWFGRFETSKPKIFSDPRWISSVFAMAMREAVTGRAAFRKDPVELKLKDEVRLIVVGDWATAIPRALKVRDQIVKQLEEPGPERHVIHLGDVYYSGWAREYEKRLLDPWPVDPADAGAIRSWTLNGNHDMYSGGESYYGTALADPRFAAQQRCSYFRLYNDEWDILGLDTSYEDGGLQDPQGKWIKEVRNGGQHDKRRKLMLLSHHQLFSAYQDGMPKLRSKLTPLLEREGGVDAWFWGHEHRCLRYEKSHEHVQYACCIGNGGVPEYMPRDENDPIKPPGAWELRKRKRKLLQPWGAFAFVVLDFKGEEVTARYIDEDGDNFCTETVDG